MPALLSALRLLQARLGAAGGAVPFRLDVLLLTVRLLSGEGGYNLCVLALRALHSVRKLPPVISASWVRSQSRSLSTPLSSSASGKAASR